MKKAILQVFIYTLFSTLIFAASDSLIIPQKDKIYSDLSYLVSAGLIKSAGPEYFNTNAITKPEAASYIIEATDSLASTVDAKAEAMLKKYAAAYAAEIGAIKNGEIKVVAANTPEPGPVEKLSEDLNWLEKEFEKTRFTDATGFKVTGIISGRWQNLEMFGITNLHRSTFGGSHIELGIESALTSNIRINTNMTLEPPYFNPANGLSSDLTNLGGADRPLWLDVYTITLDIYGVRAVTGFFWEDITSLVASQGQTERIGIFDRDIYAGEEGTKSYFERVFRNFSQNRDQRWSKHQFRGVELFKDGLFGKDVFKIMGGRAMDSIDKGYGNEYAAKYTHFRNFPGIRKAEWSLNLYNNSNDIRESVPYTASEPESLKKNISIIGADMKAVILGLFSLKAEYERSFYNGAVEVAAGSQVPVFEQGGNAFYAHLSPTFMPKFIDLTVKYTFIEPDYVAPASAVTDTNLRSVSTLDPAVAVITPLTFAGDPTSLYNNMNKIEAQAYVTVPFGILMVNYGVSSQLRATGNMFYSSHWLLNQPWWQGFYSNWGYPSAAHQPFIDYNSNRYGLSGTYTSSYMITSGIGGMATDLFEANREYMASSAVPGDTQKSYSNLMLLLRYEISRLAKLNFPLLLELYAELNKLSDGFDALPWYDPSKLFAQNNMSACLIYGIMPKMSLIGFAAMERWGAETVTPRPIDYTDSVYGAGIDYDLAGRAFLYLRLKNFYHTDWVVHENDFRGFSVWAELKSFF